MMNLFEPTRTAALERLRAFVPKAGRAYAARRNYDMGPGAHTDVSQLSPYLRCRLITEEDVLQSVLARHSPQAAEKFIQEVFWRTYWKGWLELRPGVWTSYQAELAHNWNELQTQSGLRARWEAACRGDTDIACFNAWAKELADTGYMHNHARMWFASIWIFTLNLPWALGADFFLRHLLDGDPASNTLGWRWVAGIQTPGKTYLARTSNISKFTEGRFHPKWQLAAEAPPIQSPAPPTPSNLPASGKVDPGLRTGFLLHEEDLSPNFLLDEVTPAATAVLSPQVRFGPLKTAPHVADFRAASQMDVTARWQDRLGPVQTVASASEIAAWAEAEALQRIVTPYAPVGPVATVLADLARMETATLQCIRRPFDSRAWPYATKGFFAFKKHIPALTAAVSA